MKSPLLFLVAVCALALLPALVRAEEEPRLDLQAAASPPLTPHGDITWTITANNGGLGGAYGSLAARKTFFDAGVGAGVVIFDAIPRFQGEPLALTAPPTVRLNGVETGVTGGFYYSVSRTVPDAPAQWSGAYTPKARWIALLLLGPAGSVLLSPLPNASAGAGRVWNPQIEIAFRTEQPVGVCARENDAVTNMADGVIADARGMLLGPGIPAGTADGAVSLGRAAGNGRPGSGPLRTAEFHVRRGWLGFGRERCEKRAPVGI